MNIKDIYKCGKFFIETGTSSIFKKFIYHSAQNITRYVPGIWFDNIENLINNGDRDKAIFLWIQACCKANNISLYYYRVLIFYLIAVIIFIILRIL